MLAGLTIFFSTHGLVAARGVTPYLPLNLSPEIEAKIERVLILGDKPVLRRPIAAAVVLDALPKACLRDRDLCEQVRAYLSAYKRNVGITHASAAVALNSGAKVALPNQRGETSTSHLNVSVAGHVQPSDYLIVGVGAAVNSDESTPTGTMLSVGNSYMQLDVGYRGHWTSPLTDSAMLISTEAPTMPSLTFSNYESISPLNVQYELSVSRESHSDRIATAAGDTRGNPRIANMHLEASPFAGWAVGLNRLQQFGGGSRGGDSLSSIIKAWVDPSGSDNINPGTSVDSEQGNQQASFVSSFIYPGSTPFAVYFEYAGEDTFHYNNMYLGNSSLSAGIHVPALLGRFDVVYEISEWQNSWWVHHVYQDGTTNLNRVLGHWGGDWRVFNDGVGAQTQMLKVAHTAANGTVSLRYRTIANQSYSNVQYVRGHDLIVGYSRQLQNVTVGGELQFGRDVFGERYQRLSGFARFAPSVPVGQLVGAVSDRFADAHSFVDVGVSRVRRTYDPYDPYGGGKRSYSESTSPHFGWGVRRSTEGKGDIGVRLELDRVGEMSLLSVRALDYRYRIGNHLAASLFAGATRYSTPTPAFGWYYGAGLQWRKIVGSVDFAVDYRRMDGVQRDKLLASDYQGGAPDEFYQMGGLSAYLSYQF